MDYECFCIYGFGVDYPADWEMVIGRKLTRAEGTVAFRSAEGMEIGVSWGPLKEAKGRFSSVDEQARDALNRLKKSRGIINFQILEDGRDLIHEHEAVFNHARAELAAGGLFGGGKKQTEILSMHLYCDKSERYFVLYGKTTLERTYEYADVFSHMRRSFKCHTAELKKHVEY
jgi:hypothetical protein